MSVRAKIETCVEKFIASGGKIVDEDWNVEFHDDRYLAGEYKDASGVDVEEDDAEAKKPACCPLGAVLVAHDPRAWFEDKDKDAAALLGVTETWVSNFINAFDGGDEGGVEDFLEEAYDIGQYFREKYIDE